MTSLVHESTLLAGRTARHWRAQPGAFLLTAAFPLLVLLLMTGLLGGAIAGGTRSYLQLAVPGILAVTMLFGLETTMIAVAGDAATSVTDRLRSLPIRALSVLGGSGLADVAASVIGLALVVLGGLALGWRPGSFAGLAVAAVLLLWLRIGLLWVGIYGGLTARGPESVAAVQILVWPISMLSTAYVDPTTMPTWLGLVAELNPLSATVTAVRELCGASTIVGSTWATEHARVLAVVWPALLTAAFLPLSVRTYRRLGD